MEGSQERGFANFTEGRGLLIGGKKNMGYNYWEILERREEANEVG